MEEKEEERASKSSLCTATANMGSMPPVDLDEHYADYVVSGWMKNVGSGNGPILQTEFLLIINRMSLFLIQ